MNDAFKFIDRILKNVKKRPSKIEAVPKPCPDETVLSAYMDGNLPLSDEQKLIEHLSDCSQCRRTLMACIDSSSMDNADVTPANTADLLEAELATMEKSLGIGKRLSDDMVKPPIAVVDDDPVYLNSLVDTLSNEYEVTAFCDGLDAVKGISDDYKAVVLDIKMSGLSGLEVSDLIKSKHCSIPIIFNTGYPGDFVREDIKARYKPFGYVTKDDPNCLLSTIRQASGNETYPTF